MRKSMLRGAVAASALIVTGLFAPMAQAAEPASSQAAKTASSAGDVVAQSCLSNEEVYWTDGGSNNYAPSSGWYTATERCNDINIRGGNETNRAVRVCFNPRSGSSYCQSSYSSARVAEWSVIANDVLPGTRYRLDFLTSEPAQGWVAA
ncbi:hypothetical protein EV191_1011438 [Tamaricihabitans halophyticus]|uniref:Peptidase inhibitor family I36 n=1 Tax=Tamaricihabitans halophyticus TaxID=1262583 RepID=A0A4R2RCM4_9PSEU|nr:hypothetical protein [Tamaricihabitans halophyticus]TCP57481.1 hypothetical protein EV191_1011438 [Tamaricihabitans halophyticus]